MRRSAELNAVAYPVGVLVCPSIDTVVGGIQGPLREPDDVPCFEPSGSDGAKGAMPVQGFSGDLETGIDR